MKLIDALPRLGMRFPHILAETDPEKQRVLVEAAVIDAREDIAVLQVLAHSLRTTAQWQTRAPSRVKPEVSRATIMGKQLGQLTDAELNKRASYGGSATVRAAINAEKLRRAQDKAREDQGADLPGYLIR